MIGIYSNCRVVCVGWVPFEKKISYILWVPITIQCTFCQRVSSPSLHVLLSLAHMVPVLFIYRCRPIYYVYNMYNYVAYISPSSTYMWQVVTTNEERWKQVLRVCRLGPFYRVAPIVIDIVTFGTCISLVYFCLVKQPVWLWLVQKVRSKC